jgi:hypothetical protein
MWVGCSTTKGDAHLSELFGFLPVRVLVQLVSARGQLGALRHDLGFLSHVPSQFCASQLRLFFSRARRFAARAGGTCVVGVSTDLTVRRDRVVSRDSTVSSGARAMTVSSTPRFLTKSSFFFLPGNTKTNFSVPLPLGASIWGIRLGNVGSQNLQIIALGRYW